jgi:hypothetical protein
MATRNVIQGEPIVLDLSRNGGGQLIVGNNANDNRIYLEGFSRDGNESSNLLPS